MDLHTLENRVHNIRLQIHAPDGIVHRIGDNGPLVNWHLHTHCSLLSILKRPEINLGSSYVRGEWDVDTWLLPGMSLEQAQRTRFRALTTRLQCARDS